MGTISIRTEDTKTIFTGVAKKRTDGVDSVMDLSSFANAVDLIFKGPDRVTLADQSATIVSAAAGTFSLTTSTALFTGNRGTWSVQAKYTLVGGGVLYSDIKTFEVGEVLGQ